MQLIESPSISFYIIIINFILILFISIIETLLAENFDSAISIIYKYIKRVIAILEKLI